MNKNTPINIVTFFDNNLEIQAAILIHNIARLSRDSRPISLYIFVIGKTDVDFKAEAENLKTQSFTLHVEYLENPENFIDDRRYSHLATAYRLLLGDLLPDINRVIYIDIDILILGDLERLFDTSLEGNVLGASPAWSMEQARARNVNLGLSGLALQMPAGQYLDDIIGMKDCIYFNAGVLLIDLELWRNKKIKEQCFQFFENNLLLLFTDQDALNHVLRKNVYFLDEGWNFEPSSLRGNPKNVSIIHFTGQKPWDPLKSTCSERETAEKEYWKFALQTPYGKQLLQSMYNSLDLKMSEFMDVDSKIPKESKMKILASEFELNALILKEMGKLVSTIGKILNIPRIKIYGERLQGIASLSKGS